MSDTTEQKLDETKPSIPGLEDLCTYLAASGTSQSKIATVRQVAEVTFPDKEAFVSQLKEAFGNNTLTVNKVIEFVTQKPLVAEEAKKSRGR